MSQSVPAADVLDRYPGVAWEIRRSATSDEALAALGPYAGNVVVVEGGRIHATRGAIDEPIAIFSASKSITAMVFGVLKERGSLDFDDTIPGSDVPARPQATFLQFLSMTSDYGLQPHAPGEHCAYNNHAVHFYGEYMRREFFLAADPSAVLEAAFWSQIGREDPVWFHGQWGGWDGGFRVSTRDVARLGLLVLRRGAWNGTQILSRDFVDALYRPRVPVHMPLNLDQGPNNQFNQHGSTRQLPGRYSLGFWLGGVDTDGASMSNAADWIFMAGRGGNYVIVHPRLDLVIAVTNTEVERRPKAAAYLAAVCGEAAGRASEATIT